MYSEVEVLACICPQCGKTGRVTLTYEEYRDLYVRNLPVEVALSNRSKAFQIYIKYGTHYDCQRTLRKAG